MAVVAVRSGGWIETVGTLPAAVRLSQENGIAVIPGTCPNQYLRPDLGHRLMRAVIGLLGNLRLREPEAQPLERVAH